MGLVLACECEEHRISAMESLNAAGDADSPICDMDGRQNYTVSKDLYFQIFVKVVNGTPRTLPTVTLHSQASSSPMYDL
jgi:hypothetical protein